MSSPSTAPRYLSSLPPSVPRMASIPCSIHAELSSAAPPWSRLSPPPCSVSSGLSSAGRLRTPFLGLAKTPGGLRGSSGVRAEAGPGGGGGGGGVLVKIWSSGIAAGRGGIHSRLDGASQVGPNAPPLSSHLPLFCESPMPPVGRVFLCLLE